MSLSYRVDAENRLLLVRADGPITLESFRLHWKEVFTDREAMNCSRVLVDVRGAEIKFAGPEIMELTRSVYAPKIRGRRFRVAVVVDGMLQFGVARQLQMVADAEHTHRVFFDRDEAMDWLLNSIANGGV